MFVLINQILRSEDRSINFTRTPAKWALLNSFFQARKQGIEKLSHAELSPLVYSTPAYPQVSIRMWDSSRQKLTKLIARTRRYLDAMMRGSACDDLEWFPYDKVSKSWMLYKKRGQQSRIQGRND